MATGILGTPTELTAATNATVYTVPSNTFAVVTVNICNRSADARAVRLAVAATGTPGNNEYLEYDVQLLGRGALERTGIVMDAGRNIVAYADNTEVSVMVYGIETPTS